MILHGELQEKGEKEGKGNEGFSAPLGCPPPTTISWASFRPPDHIFPCTFHPQEILTHGVRAKLQQGIAVASGACARLYTVVAI